MVNDSPKPGESWITFYRTRKRFADLILMAWIVSEYFINQLFTKQFDMYFDYPEAKILIDMSFEKKLQYLKKFEIFSKDEFLSIQKFQRSRNKLFHGKNPEYMTWSDSKKEMLMDEAIEATNIITKALSSGKKIKKTDLRFDNGVQY